MKSLYERALKRMTAAGAGALSVLSSAALLAQTPPMGEPAVTREVALTFDDLPAVGTRTDLATHQAITTKLLDGLARHDIRASAFVNEGKLFTGQVLDTNRVALLRAWIAAGHELGNHTFSHRSLFRTPLAEFQDDVLRGEQVTRPLVEQAGGSFQYFRHPFLNTGPDLATKRAFEAFLSQNDYRIAPVTIDNQEWIFARAYDRRLDKLDTVAAQRVAVAYITYMDSIFAYYEQQSRAFLGYEPPQVLLLHANRLNADVLDNLVTMIRRRDYAFITLSRALLDPAYARPDEYSGSAGITWLHRWALTAGKRGAYFAGEPAVPDFVLLESGIGVP